MFEDMNNLKKEILFLFYFAWQYLQILGLLEQREQIMKHGKSINAKQSAVKAMKVN